MVLALVFDPAQMPPATRENLHDFARVLKEIGADADAHPIEAFLPHISIASIRGEADALLTDSPADYSLDRVEISGNLLLYSGIDARIKERFESSIYQRIFDPQRPKEATSLFDHELRWSKMLSDHDSGLEKSPAMQNHLTTVSGPCHR